MKHNEEEQKADAVLTSLKQFQAQIRNKGAAQNVIPEELTEEIQTKTKSLLEER